MFNLPSAAPLRAASTPDSSVFFSVLCHPFVLVLRQKVVRRTGKRGQVPRFAALALRGGLTALGSLT